MSIRVAFAVGAALLAVGVAYAVGFVVAGGAWRALVALVAATLGLVVLVPAGFALGMLK
jgi:hypothetical protein